MNEFDVLIIGAGSAGVGAGLELSDSGLSFRILEAAHRVGGRAHTDTSSLSVPWDHGAHWLHSADVNPLVKWADRLSVKYLREERSDHFTIWQNEQFVTSTDLIAARDATIAAGDAIEAAGEMPVDVSLADAIPDAGRWRAGVRCVLQSMTGADPEKVSVKDYLGYEDTDLNWPVLSGYGNLISRMAANFPIDLGVTVEAIEQRANEVSLRTNKGELKAKAVIVTVSTSVLTANDIRFSKGPAADFLEIVSDLPCGRYEKVALEVEDLPQEAEGRIFCMIDPGSGENAIDFQIMPTTPSVMIAHLAGDTLDVGCKWDEAAKTDIATERLIQAFGSSFRKKILRTGATDWTNNPLTRVRTHSQ